jgi:hypothetical protein
LLIFRLADRGTFALHFSPQRIIAFAEKRFAIYRPAEPSTDTHPPTLMQVPVPGTCTKPAP